MTNKKRGILVSIVAAVIVIIIVAVTLLAGNNSDTAAKKIGFIMTGSKSDHGWNGMHYSGIEYACEQMQTELMVEENITEGTGQCEQAIRRLADNGAEMIILSSYNYPAETLEVIKHYSHISFYCISSDHDASNLTPYFGRMYQPRYLAGIIAGMQTESNIIGYIAAMPNNEVNRGINAFTLGVKKVNPDAVVKVIWTNSWDNEQYETEAVSKLVKEYNADVITYHQNKPYCAVAADALGIYSIGYNETAEGLSDKYLASIVWNCESLYMQIVKEFYQGKPNQVERHWFDISTGVIDLDIHSPLVSEQTAAAVTTARNSINSGVDVFSGVIYDNEGKLRCGEDETISDHTLHENMNWYVNGVIICE